MSTQTEVPQRQEEPPEEPREHVRVMLRGRKAAECPVCGPPAEGGAATPPSSEREGGAGASGKGPVARHEAKACGVGEVPCAVVGSRVRVEIVDGELNLALCDAYEHRLIQLPRAKKPTLADTPAATTTTSSATEPINTTAQAPEAVTTTIPTTATTTTTTTPCEFDTKEEVVYVASVVISYKNWTKICMLKPRVNPPSTPPTTEIPNTTADATSPAVPQSQPPTEPTKPHETTTADSQPQPQPQDPPQPTVDTH
ncbi:hypothetical protein Pelo_12115 [Pelomyxa schiedti]|nr:hypothetical protein Pelo_12115 [Pelomyxa schiedti]